MISDDQKSLLFQASVFSGLSNDQISSVLDTAKEAVFQAGETIMTEGEEGGELYVIVEGSVQIEKNAGNDLTIKIAHAENKGMMIGEMSLIDMKPRSATVRAISEVTMIMLERGALADLFDKDPKILATISLNIARALSVRLRSSNEMFSEFFNNFTA